MQQSSERPSEEELVSRVRSGDQIAFRQLVERHRKDISRTVVAMLGPAAEVDEVVQDVFIRFYSTLDRFREEASVLTYLKKIAVNRSLDALRSRKRRLSRFISREDEAHSMEELGIHEVDTLESANQHMLIHKAIQTLPPKQRLVVVLRMIEGYSTEETAKILGLRYGTVLSRLSRGLAKLKVVLEPYRHLLENGIGSK